MNRKQICEQETNLRQRLKPPVDRSRTIRRKLLFYVATHNNSVDLVQKGIFADLFHMVFAVFRGIRYSKRISKKCTPWFLQYFGRLGTAVPILRFVPLDFSNMCSTITRNLRSVPKIISGAGKIGVHSLDIYLLYPKDQKTMGNKFKKSSSVPKRYYPCLCRHEKGACRTCPGSISCARCAKPLFTC